MNALLTIAWILLFASAAAALMVAEDIVWYMIKTVNWNLVFILVFSALIIITFTRKK